MSPMLYPAEQGCAKMSMLRLAVLLQTMSSLFSTPSGNREFLNALASKAGKPM